MDTDDLKKFMLHHFEKMIFGVVVAVSAFLIYRGLQYPNFLSTHQPGQLTTNASRVKGAIDEDHNEAIIPERVPTFDILKQTQKLYTAVDGASYKLDHTWEGIALNSVVRRDDPELLPPLDLRTAGVLTSIAVRGSTKPDDYPLATLENADSVEKTEQPNQRRRRSRPSRRNNMEMSGSSMDEMLGMGPPGMSDEMMSSSGMVSAPIRSFNAKYDFGYRPMPNSSDRQPKPAMGWFIAGTALLPHKEIYEAFELALKKESSYNYIRDTPIYYNFEVQRADVTDKPIDQLTEDDWKKVWNRLNYTQLAAKVWSGFAPEIVPADYRDKNLTIWIPPVLLDDYTQFSLHPRIPLTSRAELLQKAEMAVTAVETAAVEDFKFETDGNVTLAGPGGLSGPGGAPFGMRSEMTRSGGMHSYGRGEVEEDPVEHKLIRFYDFAGMRIFPNPPEFGHTYVYRIRYAVNDPNFPADPRIQPKTSSLGPEVAKRVLDLKDEEREKRVRSFERWSDWSEPSEPATLPSLEDYFAGPVVPSSSSTMQLAGREVEYRRDPPKAKIVVTQFNPKYSVKVPIRIEVTEGSVLSQSAESTDVVDPITLVVKALPNPEFISGTTVISLGGGDPLAFDQELTEPGRMLLFDQSGKLRVTNDVGDQLPYRIYSFAEERGE